MTNEQILKVVLISLCFFFCRAKFQERKNVFVVVDTNPKDAHTVRKVVSEILDSISLLKYRIGLYSTNGFSQKILDFQSRQCSEKIFRHTRKHQFISKTFKEVSKELKHFRTSPNIIVVITTRHKVYNLRKHLNRIGHGTRNEAKYIIQLQRLRSGSIKNILWKSTRLAAWKHTRLVKNGFHRFLKKIFHWLHFTQENLNQCKTPKNQNSNVYDECRRVCQCIDGRLVNCYRLREQFSALPLARRVQYINTYKKAATDKRFQKYFYQLVLIHPTVDFIKVHSTAELLPFHRKYVLKMENLFRLIDCRVTIPYWNFALPGKRVFKPAPGYHIWDKVGGFGSTKTHVKNGFCLENGPFRYPLYKLPKYFVKELSNKMRKMMLCPQNSLKSLRKCLRVLKKTFKPRCVTRSLTKALKFQSYTDIYRKLHNPRTDFYAFKEYISQECHATIHDNLGGDFGAGYSSLLPEFFPLHSFIDAMWDYWQKQRRYSERWLHDKKKKIIGFHTPRFWYVDNNNLEECGVKITYTNIFPKSIKKKAYVKYDKYDDDFIEDSDDVDSDRDTPDDDRDTPDDNRDTLDDINREEEYPDS